ncbi:hypothetical protein BB560_000671 [Smittium megazygosporum]|uniref:Uncharacterized protein n=1 Tax=Smittium megazygosporum TaxID=133381 RepID=A0A2T9ZDV5_9FUNG|nr:hypothetical protein BB560_002737 [Smittium megazygosporum]PVV04816.1 hypothetical protein BB560_000671 [Smittium megazygosporum]
MKPSENKLRAKNIIFPSNSRSNPTGTRPQSQNRPSMSRESPSLRNYTNNSHTPLNRSIDPHNSNSPNVLPLNSYTNLTHSPIGFPPDFEHTSNSNQNMTPAQRTPRPRVLSTTIPNSASQKNVNMQFQTPGVNAPLQRSISSLQRQSLASIHQDSSISPKSPIPPSSNAKNSRPLSFDQKGRTVHPSNFNNPLKRLNTANKQPSSPLHFPNSENSSLRSDSKTADSYKAFSNSFSNLNLYSNTSVSDPKTPLSPNTNNYLPSPPYGSNQQATPSNPGRTVSSRNGHTVPDPLSRSNSRIEPRELYSPLSYNNQLSSISPTSQNLLDSEKINLIKQRVKQLNSGISSAVSPNSVSHPNPSSSVSLFQEPAPRSVSRNASRVDKNSFIQSFQAKYSSGAGLTGSQLINPKLRTITPFSASSVENLDSNAYFSDNVDQALSNRTSRMSNAVDSNTSSNISNRASESDPSFNQQDLINIRPNLTTSFELDGDSIEAAEARVSRKIMDLEITKKSLLNLNSSLESQLKNQMKYVSHLENKIKNSQQEKLVYIYSDEHLEQDPDQVLEKAVKEDLDFQRMMSTLENLISKTEEAIVYKSEHVAKVISLKDNKDLEDVLEDKIRLNDPLSLQHRQKKLSSLNQISSLLTIDTQMDNNDVLGTAPPSAHINPRTPKSNYQLELPQDGFIENILHEKEILASKLKLCHDLVLQLAGSAPNNNNSLIEKLRSNSEIDVNSKLVFDSNVFDYSQSPSKKSGNSDANNTNQTRLRMSSQMEFNTPAVVSRKKTIDNISPSLVSGANKMLQNSNTQRQAGIKGNNPQIQPRRINSMTSPTSLNKSRNSSISAGLSNRNPSFDGKKAFSPGAKYENESTSKQSQFNTPPEKKRLRSDTQAQAANPDSLNAIEPQLQSFRTTLSQLQNLFS